MSALVFLRPTVLNETESLTEVSPTRGAAAAEAQRQAEAQQRVMEEEKRRKEEEKKFHQELIAKRQETRMRIIDEIMQTERDYLQSLSLVCDNFLGSDAEKVNIKLVI